MHRGVEGLFRWRVLPQPEEFLWSVFLYLSEPCCMSGKIIWTNRFSERTNSIGIMVDTLYDVGFLTRYSMTMRVTAHIYQKTCVEDWTYCGGPILARQVHPGSESMAANLFSDLRSIRRR